MSENKNIEGIKGWLYLIAIGVVIMPCKIAILLATYPIMFSNGTWDILTTEGTKLYNPLWAPLLSGEIFINSVLILAWVFMAYKFFTKSKLFPKLYIGVVIFSLVFIISDAYAFNMIHPAEPVFDPDTVKELMRSIITVVVWVPYMLMSKRVKATFIHA